MKFKNSYLGTKLQFSTFSLLYNFRHFLLDLAAICKGVYAPLGTYVKGQSSDFQKCGPTKYTVTYSSLASLEILALLVILAFLEILVFLEILAILEIRTSSQL